jgi:hypothetical protein
MDRHFCLYGQLKPLKGFARRVWSSVNVKCGNHSDGCTWTGSIGDFAAHANLCDGRRFLRDQIEALEQENAELNEELTKLAISALLENDVNDVTK